MLMTETVVIKNFQRMCSITKYMQSLSNFVSFVADLALNKHSSNLFQSQSIILLSRGCKFSKFSPRFTPWTSSSLGSCIPFIIKSVWTYDCLSRLFIVSLYTYHPWFLSLKKVVNTLRFNLTNRDAKRSISVSKKNSSYLYK